MMTNGMETMINLIKNPNMLLRFLLSPLPMEMPESGLAVPPAVCANAGMDKNSKMQAVKSSQRSICGFLRGRIRVINTPRVITKRKTIKSWKYRT